MKEQFVTYEIALKLKELGFDEECFSAYTEDGGLMDIGNYSNYDKIGELDGHSYYISCLSPLWQQVIDWFREKYNLHITITSQSQESWQWHIQFPHDSLNKMWEEDFYTYEEAREQAILKAIQIINGRGI